MTSFDVEWNPKGVLIVPGVTRILSGIARTVGNVDYHFPSGRSGLETPVCIGPGSQGKAIVIKQRMQMPVVRKRSHITQYSSMTFPVTARDQRKHHEYDMQGKSLRMCNREIHSFTSVGSHDAAVGFRSFHGRVQILAPYRIEDGIEANAGSQTVDIRLDLFFAEIDDFVGAQTPRPIEITVRSNRSRYLASKRFRDLNGHMTDASCAAMHKHVIGKRGSYFFECLYRGDAHQRERALSRIESLFGFGAISFASATMYSASVPPRPAIPPAHP